MNPAEVLAANQNCLRVRVEIRSPVMFIRSLFTSDIYNSDVYKGVLVLVLVLGMSSGRISLIEQF